MNKQTNLWSASLSSTSNLCSSLSCIRLVSCNWQTRQQCINKLEKFTLTASLFNTHTHTHAFNGPLSGTTQVSRYQKGKTNLDFTEARDHEWQWHQLGHMQVYTSLETDNHASTPQVRFIQAGCPSCCPTNSTKALKAKHHYLRYN